MNGCWIFTQFGDVVFATGAIKKPHMTMYAGTHNITLLVGSHEVQGTKAYPSERIDEVLMLMRPAMVAGVAAIDLKDIAQEVSKKHKLKPGEIPKAD